MLWGQGQSSGGQGAIVNRVALKGDVETQSGMRGGMEPQGIWEELSG